MNKEEGKWQDKVWRWAGPSISIIAMVFWFIIELESYMISLQGYMLNLELAPRRKTSEERVYSLV